MRKRSKHALLIMVGIMLSLCGCSHAAEKPQETAADAAAPGAQVDFGRP